MSSRTSTPMEPQATNGKPENTGSAPAGARDTGTVNSSSEPVYRFYLSPPPTGGVPPGGMTTGGMPAAYPSTQTHAQAPTSQEPPKQQQPMYQSPLGMMPFNPYMAMSPPAMAGVSAFGHPAYYAPTPQQSFYYPSAFGVPAAVPGGVPAAVPGGVQARGSTVSSGSAPPGQSEEQQQQTKAMPIVNGAGVPMGGFGTDQDGQYIEIKFPTFGQAQVQQMLQQLHIQPEAAAAAARQQIPPAFVASGGQQLPPAFVASGSDGQVSRAKLAASEKPTQEKADGASGQTPNISIYDAEHFADAHMEEIVFDRKAFFWKIDNWDRLERRATSDVFRCGGFAWRILLRPFGSSHKGVLSLFLECLGTDTSDDWRCTTRFVLAIANPHDPTHNTHGAAYHCFHRNNPNWGFTRFMKLADLRTAPAPGVRPYIEDGACTIGAYLHVIKDPSQ